MAKYASVLVMAGLLLTGCQPPQPEIRKSDPKAATGTIERTELEVEVEIPKVPEIPFPEVSFEVSELGGKTMLMHYMPWYEAPPFRPWGTHWTGHQREHNPDVMKDNGQPDIWSHYHPLIGLYDSTDPHVLECHLLQMKLAGINGVIADWYGIYPYADFPPIHDATMALFDACERYGMTFSACYEDRTVDLLVNHFKILPPEDIQPHLNGIFTWMEENWFGADHYQRYRQQPLVLNFGPMYEAFRNPAPWAQAVSGLKDKPIMFALHHLWRQAGFDGGFSWVSFDALEAGQSRETNLRRLNESFTWFTADPSEAIVSAFPGFKDVYGPGGEPNQLLQHRDGDVLRETLEVGIGGPWDMIQVVTWNDYGEGTMIEPTHEFGYLFLEIIQEARREELGDSFAFTPEDLRLPAKLLKLRRSGEYAPSQLDAIAAMIAEGYCQEARTLLYELEPGD